VLLLAARLCVDVVGLVRPGLRRVAAPVVAVVLAVALVFPLTSSFAFDRGLSGIDTRQVAREWIQRNVPGGSLIALENYSPPLVQEDALDHYRAAGLDPVAYRVIRLKLPAPGAPDRSRDLSRLRRQGVEYVVVSSRIYDRVLAAPEVYPTIVEFYRQLDVEAQLVKEFRPGPGERGPVLKLYRILGGPGGKRS
jgi:hypothetical protein